MATSKGGHSQSREQGGVLCFSTSKLSPLHPCLGQGFPLILRIVTDFPMLVFCTVTCRSNRQYPHLPRGIFVLVNVSSRVFTSHPLLRYSRIFSRIISILTGHVNPYVARYFCLVSKSDGEALPWCLCQTQGRFKVDVRLPPRPAE